MPLFISTLNYAKLHQLIQVKKLVGRFHVSHMKVLLYTVFKDHEARFPHCSSQLSEEVELEPEVVPSKLNSAVHYWRPPLREPQMTIESKSDRATTSDHTNRSPIDPLATNSRCKHRHTGVFSSIVCGRLVVLRRCFHTECEPTTCTP